MSEHLNEPTRVSVIVPCYNIADYIDECVESVLRQSFTAIEVVLVDDGSNDGTSDRLDAWLGLDDRVTLIRQPNGGLGAARNAGVAAASGQYLFFLDGDDVLPDDAIERMVEAATASGSDIVSGVVMRFDGTRQWRSGLYGSVFDAEPVATHLFREPRLIVDQMACSKLIRRDFWDRHELEFPVDTLFEDALVMTRAHCLASGVDLIGTPTYLWRLRPESITSDRFRPGSVAQRFAVVSAVDDYLRNHAPDEVWRAHGDKVCAHDLRMYARLAVDAGTDEFADFVSCAQPVLRSLHPDAGSSVSSTAKLLRRFVIDGNITGARACALMMSEGDTRSIGRIVRGLADPWPRSPIVGLRVAASALKSLVD
jgi:glycosyltransferase involved in cell wall biosynthesis